MGKSSLINSLCRNSKLARISASPGKTRLINYFKINDSFYLVDLPGYGYAKVSKTEQESWGKLMESYLSSGNVSHIFMLIDIRHEPTAADKQMLEWIIYYGVPYTLVATKRINLRAQKDSRLLMRTQSCSGRRHMRCAIAPKMGMAGRSCFQELGLFWPIIGKKE